MSTATAEAVREASTSRKVRHREAARFLRDLADSPVRVRRAAMREMSVTDLKAIAVTSSREMGTPFGLWQDDALGFVEDVLGERTWRTPKKLLRAMPTHDRIAVPSAFSTGKTWTVSRAVLWHVNVWPVGTSKTVTIASKFDQVKDVIWPEIRLAHKRAGLPGRTDVTQLTLPTPSGTDFKAAWGIGAAPHNEAAVQGHHAPHVLLVVDEAGGIGRRVGRNLRALLTADGTAMVAIGNPPTDDEGSWFEVLCSEDDVLTIPISAMSSPNLTGETTARCRSCPDEVPEHALSVHLASVKAVQETIALHGPESAYVQAKVHARFPKGGPSRALPMTWLEEAAALKERPAGEHDVMLSDLEVPGETDRLLVRRGSRVNLGVDVAADGGDELVIARMIGDLIQVRHVSSGSTNTNVTDVAGKVLHEVRQAEAVLAALGSTVRVRVKIDAIGIGWGVAGILESWAEPGQDSDGTQTLPKHHSEIVKVIVSEGTNRPVAEASTFRPANKRAEMWLAMRTLVEPQEGVDPMRLRVDKQTLAQLGAPQMGTNAQGLTVIETKPSMRRRGLKSPDRAEAVLLAPYEPVLSKPARRPRLVL